MSPIYITLQYLTLGSNPHSFHLTANNHLDDSHTCFSFYHWKILQNFKEDIEYWDDSLTDEINTIRSLLNSVHSKRSHTERSAILSSVEKKIASTAGMKRALQVEIRLVSDPDVRRRYENRLVRHKEALSAVGSDLKALRANEHKGQLFVGASQVGPAPSADDVNPEKAGDIALKEANVLQDRTAESLANTKRMIEESKEVGRETTEELQRQTQTIADIYEEALRTENRLVRAKKLIKIFGRRMMMDKLIQIFALVNICLLVGVVFFLIFHKGGSNSGQGGSGSKPSGRMLLRGFSLDEFNKGRVDG